MTDTWSNCGPRPFTAPSAARSTPSISQSTQRSLDGAIDPFAAVELHACNGSNAAFADETWRLINWRFRPVPVLRAARGNTPIAVVAMLWNNLPVAAASLRWLQYAAT